MYKIYLPHKEKEFNTFEDFKRNFKSICESHQKQDRALCFAFVLYRNRDAQIPGILSNNNYWEALNEISGKYLTVFSFLKENADVPFSYMVGIGSIGIKPSDATEYILENYFDLEEEIVYPSILFFQVAKDEIIQPFFVKLNEEENEKSFLEIKRVFEIAEETLKKISNDNKKNHKEIINLVLTSIESDRSIKVIKSRIKAAGKLIKFLAPFRHFLGSV